MRTLYHGHREPTGSYDPYRPLDISGNPVRDGNDGSAMLLAMLGGESRLASISPFNIKLRLSTVGIAPHPLPRAAALLLILALQAKLGVERQGVPLLAEVESLVVAISRG